jgi:hypothetical protein
MEWFLLSGMVVNAVVLFLVMLGFVCLCSAVVVGGYMLYRAVYVVLDLIREHL